MVSSIKPKTFVYVSGFHFVFVGKIHQLLLNMYTYMYVCMCMYKSIVVSQLNTCR